MNYRYYVKRTAMAIFTLYVALSLTFVLLRWIPGGPEAYVLSQLVQQGHSPQEAELMLASQMEHFVNINPDDPVYVQYWDYVVALGGGDLGESFLYGRSVSSILMDALPWTVFLIGSATMVIFITGILMGAVQAYLEGGRFDVSMTTVQTILTSIPYYVFAILLIDTFAFQWELFPRGGRVGSGLEPLSLEFIGSAFYHATLPFLSLLIAAFGGPALAMRGNSIQVLGSDYMRVGRLRGLSTSRLATRYVARNAVLPLYTGFMIGLAGFFSGAVILETIFSYPGMGYYLLQGFVARDYPLMMGGFVILTGVTIFGIWLADLTYGLIDPRIETGDENAAF